nr:MAG TPA: hypothetical protein [Caudoviricetes sp.]
MSSNCCVITQQLLNNYSRLVDVLIDVLSQGKSRN